MEPTQPVPEAPKRRVTVNKVMAGIAVAGIVFLVVGGTTNITGLLIAGFIMLMLAASWFFVI